MRIALRFFLMCLFLCALQSYAVSPKQAQAIKDSTEVDRLNKLAFEKRQKDPIQTLALADKALSLSKKIGYNNGTAEAYRMRGLAKVYQNQIDSAIAEYFKSLDYLKKANNQPGLAKIYNNMGSVYRMIKDHESLIYYNKSLAIATKLDMKPLIAGLHLNMGIVYQKLSETARNKGRPDESRRLVAQALSHYEESNRLFQKLGLLEGLSTVHQSLSSIYKDLGNWQKAEPYAVSAIKLAKEEENNYVIASTNITLSVIYISTNRYKEAERSIDEGIFYAKRLGDEKMEHDFAYRRYQLFNKQGDFRRALASLTEVYRQDSIHNEKYESDKIRVLQEQTRRIETENKNLRLAEQERNNRIIFWAGILVMALLAVVVLLLIKNVSKKAQTNRQLTALNEEISQQKENLDRINHNLEEIIDERTRDLKIKNKKLSEYSSHLSHQIRGPVATLKGLMNLNREGLIDKDEVIQQTEKCVFDIDDKILRINDMLHDPKQDGFSNPSQKAPDPLI